MRRVIASAPVRIDLAGGWSDVAPYTDEHPGEVVNIAIDKRAHCELLIDVDGMLSVNYHCEVPVGSGLGTSSAINVALLACIKQGAADAGSVAEMAHHLERIMGGPVGRQDQWASGFGGAQHLMFYRDTVEQLPFEPLPSAIRWLEGHLVLAHSGIEHDSGSVHAPVWERFEAGDQQVIDALGQLKVCASKMADALQKDRRDLVVAVLNQVTQTTDLLDEGINAPLRPFCERLMGQRNIAAWKVMGAGGGGAVALLARHARIEETKAACEAEGWRLIDWSLEPRGLLVEVEESQG